jgi:mannose/cellobiose epimerase-like protein (N-acyl-D-glucosamine 2-epimerase family)
LTVATLRPAVARLREWALQRAFPLWADQGFDHEHGRFEERLSLRGERLHDVPIRLIVQARQIYSYGLASRRGWHRDGRSLVERAYASMVRDFHRRDGQDGWIFSIHRNGTVADPRRDLYAHAFVLLAIASYVQATGKREALSLADETLAYLDRHMSAAEGGGYLDCLPPVDALRRQNPHMHMLEGLLSLWSGSSEPRFLARAGEIFGLFTARFFDPEHGTLGEYFDARLKPADGVAGTIVEPGHHYEWVWLLRWFQRESGRAVQRHIDALYFHADSHGYDAAGLIADELLSDGSPRTRSRRAWPITEAIKANVAEAAFGRANSELKAAALTGLLLDRFLTAERTGGWIDRLDEKGACATDFMPASTLYHIVCALDELDRFVKSA